MMVNFLSNCVAKLTPFKTGFRKTSKCCAKSSHFDSPSFTVTGYVEERHATNSDSGALSSPIQGPTDATDIAKRPFTSMWIRQFGVGVSWCIHNEHVGFGQVVWLDLTFFKIPQVMYLRWMVNWPEMAYTPKISGSISGYYSRGVTGIMPCNFFFWGYL